jgi:hypothetical protein
MEIVRAAGERAQHFRGEGLFEKHPRDENERRREKRSEMIARDEAEIKKIERGRSGDVGVDDMAEDVQKRARAVASRRELHGYREERANIEIVKIDNPTPEFAGGGMCKPFEVNDLGGRDEDLVGRKRSANTGTEDGVKRDGSK